jgi:hypothetical protein
MRLQRCVSPPALITPDDFKLGEPPKRRLWALLLALLRYGLQLEWRLAGAGAPEALQGPHRLLGVQGYQD